MRSRAGTHPVTLEPARVVEVLALARRHDEMLRQTRQDLFRAETKLNTHRAWRWPIRAAYVGVGVVGMAAWQNDDVRGGVIAFFNSLIEQVHERGAESLASLLIAGAAIWLAVFLVRRWLRGPTPEKQARKLMEEFARADGVASYVFAGESNPDEAAATIGALTRPENKNFRQRHLDDDNRPLASSMMRLLNRQFDRHGQLQQREPVIESVQPSSRIESA